MNFTMPYDKVVPTKSGHTIEFVAGVPTHVPKECYREVQQAGAVPENAIAMKPVANADTVVVDDPQERRTRVFAGFTALVEANKRGDFGANNVPHAAVVSKAVGFDVDPKERDALWIEFTQLSASGEAEAAKAKAAAEQAAADAAAADAAEAKKQAAADAEKAKAAADAEKKPAAEKKARAAKKK